MRIASRQSCAGRRSDSRRESERLISQYHEADAGAFVQIALAPCSPFSVTQDLMRGSAVLARHLGETEDENAFCIERYGKRPLDHLEEIGWVADDVWLAHGVRFNDEEVEPDLGTLAPGQAADIALFDLEELRFSGSSDPVAALVLCGAHRVRHLMIGGEWRVLDGEIPNIDLTRLRAQHQVMADKLASRA